MWKAAASMLDDHMRELHNMDPHQQSCSRCSLLHGEGTRCKFLPETCVCPTPHVEMLVPERSNAMAMNFAQCRREQRAAVYLMPDGSVSAPPSNAYDDCVAVDAVSKGGVRMEFPTVRSMRQFQRDYRRDENDDFTERCLVIDYDERTLRSGGDTYINDSIRREDEARERVYERERRGQVFYGGDEYDRRVNELRRRRGQ